MRVKLGKDDKEFQMFQDYWKLFQDYWGIEDSEEYWQEMVKAFEGFCETYEQDRYAVKLASAYLCKIKERMETPC